MKVLRRVAAVVLPILAGLAQAQVPMSDAVAKASAATIEALRTDDLPAVESRFDANMRRVLPHDKVVDTASRLAQQVGAMRDCAAPTARVRDAITVVDYRCTFERGSLVVRLAWTDAVELTGLFFTPVPATPPTPVPLPANVREEAVTTGAAGWPLPGTLLVPTSVAKPAVIVLVHGSGPNDRDETIGPNAPFRDLALGLAAKGIASLRYDKRTRALGPRFVELKNWTVDDEVVDDAVAALGLVAARKDLGPVFVVGHSEGALLAPRIAAAVQRAGVPVAGIVLLAAPLTRLSDLVVYQYEFLSKLPVPTTTQELVDDEKGRRDNLRRLVELSSTGTVDPVRVAAAAALPLPLGMPASAWLDLERYDPAAVLLAQPRLPALLTFGGRDFQVPIREKALWEAKLGGRPKTTMVAFPRLNHLLIEGDGPMGPGEYDRPGHVSGALIDQVAAWIVKWTGPTF